MLQNLFSQANHNDFMACFEADGLELMSSVMNEYEETKIYSSVSRLADRLYGAVDFHDIPTPTSNLLARSAFIGGAAVARQLVLSSKIPLYRKYRILGAKSTAQIEADLHPSASNTAVFDTIRSISESKLREEFTISVVAKKVGMLYAETAEGPSRVGVRELEFTAATMGVGYLAHIYSKANQKALSE